MSTRGSTFWDDPSDQQWVPQARPWCPQCCVRADHCGCPTGEALIADYMLGPNITLGTE